MKLSERDIKVMSILTQRAAMSADSIAHAMGYRPARRGRLAVTSSLRRLHGPYNSSKISMYGSDGVFVGRLPPSNQWDCAKWFLMDRGRRAVAETEGR